MFRQNNKSFVFIFIIFGIIACSNPDNTPLPYYGFPTITPEGDSLAYQIPDFKLISQDSSIVENNDLDDFIYVADFFFMSCPSICPKVKKQMLRIYDRFESDKQLKLVSHTIDPKRDTPARLKQFAANLEVDTDKWIFLTGTKDSMMDMANAYMVSAMEDPEAPGGFDHSGKILLIDKNRNIRAFADGTEPKEVDAFMDNIDKLLSDYEID